MAEFGGGGGGGACQIFTQRFINTGPRVDWPLSHLSLKFVNSKTVYATHRRRVKFICFMVRPLVNTGSGSRLPVKLIFLQQNFITA